MISRFKTTVAAGLAMALASAVAVPGMAQTKRQKDKNNMRNLGIGLGAAAAHQALKGKTKNALILGAGAAYAGKKYEDARKAQSKENSRRYYRARGTYRIYKYNNGKRIGYWNVTNGKRGRYHALR